MSEGYLYRAVVSLAVTMVVLGAALFSTDAAWATSATSTQPVLLFNDAAQEAQLIIPTPACSKSIPKCQWMLYMNLPLMPNQPRVGYVIGKHGVLVIPYPKFCGVVQIDALRGPRSDPTTWVYHTGSRDDVHACGHPDTTTTTKPTTTTTTRPTTTTTTEAAAVVAATTPTPDGGGTTSALPFTAASSTSTTAAGTAAAQLPFTGLDFKPLGIIGATLMLLGGLLMSTVESRRRMLRRATTVTLDDVKDGARRTSSWFLGL